MGTGVPKDRAETRFAEFKPPYNDAQALAEANRCLYCEDAPCVKKCPTSIDIPEFIRKISTGNLWGSAKTIFDANILGMSCARVCPVETLCVGDCVYNEMDAPPIQIGKLQRYATDHAFAEGWRFYEAGTESGKSVALVGAGPASLAAAHELRRMGHACTIYEKRDVVGGLNTTGIAPYKMKADRSVEEAAWILDIGGIDVKTGMEFGKDIDLEKLEAEHDAVFLGFGLGADRYLPAPPEGLAGVFGSVDFIERFKLGEVSLDGIERAVVIGGGNTALDSVRELAGLGIANVELIYRGQESGMSGYQHEWKAAKVESVTARWQTLPLEYVGTTKVEGIQCVDVDDNKNPVDGSEHVVPCDLVLLAIGQGKLGQLLDGVDGIRIESGKIAVDESGATGRKGVFAAGDCVNGGKEVVNATAEGKRAAQAIDGFLRGAA